MARIAAPRRSVSADRKWGTHSKSVIKRQEFSCENKSPYSPFIQLVGSVISGGKLDLVVANAFSTVAVLQGNGNGTFQNPEYFVAGFGLRSLSIADVNGDGELDIVTADEIFDEISVLLRQ
jgi:FG-GAP-like repeat